MREICGPPLLKSFAKLDPNPATWKMLEDSSGRATSRKSSKSWQKAGMMLNGVCYLQPKLERFTDENGFGLPVSEATYPTPNVLDSTGTGRMNPNANVKKYGGVNSLGGMAETGMWPTLQSRDWKGPQGRSYKGESHDLPGKVGGKLNPVWVEWLMGWPLGWTDLKPLEMDKFQQWQQQHGKL